MLLSFLFQFELLLAVWAITKAIGLSIPLPTFFLFLPIKTFLEMIPVSVFGLGLRDLGYTIFMAAMGFGDAAAANTLRWEASFSFAAVRPRPNGRQAKTR